MKVIFLDIDGVLNCATTTKRLACSREFPLVDTRKVLRLRDIVERTGAKLVLSSTWRFGAERDAFYLEREALRELVAEFKRLRCPLWFDVTPWLPRAKRWQEINQWLLIHNIDDFIILDDWGEDEFRTMMDHIVKCNPHKGLTKERAELAIQMLGEVECISKTT